MSTEVQQKFSFALLMRVLSYAKPYKRMFFFAFLTAVILAVLSLATPMLTRYSIDECILRKDPEKLLDTILVMLGFLLLQTVLQFSNEYLSGWLGQTIIRDMRTKVFTQINRLHLQYFDKTPIGTLVTRVISDMEAVADIFSEGVLVIFSDFLKIIAIISMMFFIEWRLTLISLAVFPFLLIGANMFKNGVNKSFNEVRTQIARLNAFAQEHIEGMSIVQIFNREEEELKKFKRINAEHRNANVKSNWYYSIFFPFIEILSSVSIALIIWWGGRGVVQNHVSLGNITEFIMYINLLFRPIRLIADRFNTLQMGIVASDRVFKVMDTVNPIEANGNVVMTERKGSVEFKNVWFAYNNEDWVLKNVSLSAKQGETVAIVGATGSGKSTIVSLINRFYEYSKGEILIDHVNIREYELRSLRSQIGIVLQEVFLYSDTIANNISLGNPEISRQQIIDAAKQVGAHEFIMRLPGNYDYNVMERGATLSVGQRQLISFIRAYLYDPAILILDEATSSIDTESEVLIQRATELLMKDRTSLVIAHRLATIQKADKIIVLDKGEIIETGTHHELLAKNGYYRKLFEMQFIKEEAA